MGSSSVHDDLWELSDEALRFKSLEGCIPIRALYPFIGGGEWYIYVREGVLRAQRQHGCTLAEDLRRYGTRVAKSPLAIYRGVRRKDDDWLCYIGEKDPSSGMLYLIFVASNRVAYEWRWEEADPLEPLAPADCRIRFGEKIYESS